MTASPLFDRTCRHGTSVMVLCRECLRMPAPEPVDFSPLVAFLLARVEEELYGGGCGGPDRSCEYLADRWLSQCEATKRLALRAWATDEPYVLRCLSLPWANHPDYRAEWRP